MQHSIIFIANNKNGSPSSIPEFWIFLIACSRPKLTLNPIVIPKTLKFRSMMNMSIVMPWTFLKNGFKSEMFLRSSCLTQSLLLIRFIVSKIFLLAKLFGLDYAYFLPSHNRVSLYYPQDFDLEKIIFYYRFQTKIFAYHLVKGKF